jgi:hypothetical protein
LSAAAGTRSRLASRNASHFGATSCRAIPIPDKNYDNFNLELELDTIRELCKYIPTPLHIDLLYVIGKGLICKPSKHGIILKTDELFKHDEEFINLDGLAQKKYVIII